MFYTASDGARCADCGGRAEFATDGFRDTLGTSPDDATPLCLVCYTERCPIGWCATVGVGDGDICIGAPSRDTATSVAASVIDELADGARATEAVMLADADVPLWYTRELALGVRSSSRHVYASASARDTVVDVETFTTDDDRARLRDRLAARLVDTADVRVRSDIYDALVSLYPTLVEHGTASRLGVGSAAWERAKERGVSRASERAARNNDEGDEFEDWFADWCDDRGLDVRRGKPALRRLYPSVADEIARKTDGLAGVPDFLVRGDGQRALGGEGWRPDNATFVEVKRGTSRLTREQQDVVAHLKSQGFDVYVLRGEPDDHRFDRR